MPGATSQNQSKQQKEQALIIDQCSKIQQDELYSLQAIYLDEFEFTRAVHPYQFNIVVKPFCPSTQFQTQHFVFGRVTIELPLDYPLVKQSFIFEVEGLTNHFTREFTKKASEMCDNVMAKREKEVLDREFGEARGPIVFNVIETLREWLYDQSIGFQTQFDGMAKKESDNSLYIAPMPKFLTYTLVNNETFLIWKKKFDSESFEQKRRLKSFQQEEEFLVKTSGKLYFEKAKGKPELIKLVDDDVVDEDAIELEDEDYLKKDDEDDEDDDQPKRLYQIDYNEQ